MTTNDVTTHDAPVERDPDSPPSPWGSGRFRLFFTARSTSLLADGMLMVSLTTAVLGAGYGASGVGYALAAWMAPIVLLVLLRRRPRRPVHPAGDDGRRGPGAHGGHARPRGAPRPRGRTAVARHGAARGQRRGDRDVPARSGEPGAAGGRGHPAGQRAAADIGVDLHPARPRPRRSPRGVLGRGRLLPGDRGFYACSALGLAPLRRLGTAPDGTDEPIWQRLATGWHEFRSRSWLWGVIAVWAVYGLFVFGPALPLGAALLTEQHGADGYGWIASADGAGTIVGGLLGMRVRPRRPLVAGACAMFFFSLNPWRPPWAGRSRSRPPRASWRAAGSPSGASCGRPACSRTSRWPS